MKKPPQYLHATFSKKGLLGVQSFILSPQQPGTTTRSLSIRGKWRDEEIIFRKERVAGASRKI
jgi:hypothetical protein